MFIHLAQVHPLGANVSLYLLDFHDVNKTCSKAFVSSEVPHFVYSAAIATHNYEGIKYVL